MLFVICVTCVCFVKDKSVFTLSSRTLSSGLNAIGFIHHFVFILYSVLSCLKSYTPYVLNGKSHMDVFMHFKPRQNNCVR